MKTFKILGFLLTYPSNMHQDMMDECLNFLQNEKLVSNSNMELLEPFMNQIKKSDLLDLQEEYVALFDRTPSLSLHLFEHVHGDSRERGQAMVDLSDLYQESGLSINTHETPDYLPLFLEYVSTQPLEDVKDNLDSIVNILSALAERLRNRQSSYACIFDTLLSIASQKPDLKIVQDALKESSGKAYDLEQLDKEWEEQFAFENSKQTTGQNDGCPKAAEMLARMETYKEPQRVGK